MNRVLAALVLILGLALTETTAFGNEPSPEGKLELYAKPAIVKVFASFVCEIFTDSGVERHSESASGSGFFFNPDGYIMTNAHVVALTKDPVKVATNYYVEQYARQTNVGYDVAYTALIRKQFRVDACQHRGIVRLQTGKPFPFEIISYGTPYGEQGNSLTGKDFAILKIETHHAPTLTFGQSADVENQDRHWIIGYPAVQDLVSGIDSNAELDPSMTSGTVTRTVVTVGNIKLFQTNAVGIGKGSSGSPVINDRGEVIGLHTLGFTHDSGVVHYFIPIDSGKEFLPANVRDQVSDIDGPWREALDYFWKGDCEGAKNTLDQGVLSLFANHQQAILLRAKAVSCIALRPKVNGWLYILLATLGLVVVGCVGALALKRRGSNLAPAGMGVHRVVIPPDVRPVNRALPPTAPMNYATGGQPPPVKPGTLIATQQGQGPQIRLQCTAGPCLGHEFPVGMGVMIGRDEAAHIVVDDPQISVKHAWVGFLNGKLVVRDQGSTNGTLINGHLIERAREAELRGGDELTLGARKSVKFVVIGT